MNEADIEPYYETLKKTAEATDYFFLNPDKEFALSLCRGLLKNRERYGYASCPCRLAFGKIERDRDIICPCVYREPDVREFGTCFCALYVSKEASEGKRGIVPIPERRPPALSRR
ncbi:Ferredoxin thioredoxin reductase catalytic beta chain [Candidatus Norongarragalina meridionalis]|nr:Ferredoxin thioredoxin reductase catalytic beta chain [Candidatus Norongarragalina meridionalis]